nr:MAG TPA: hypothetical protein [Caudoviricetes sp.]
MCYNILEIIMVLCHNENYCPDPAGLGDEK